MPIDPNNYGDLKRLEEEDLENGSLDVLAQALYDDDVLKELLGDDLYGTGGVEPSPDDRN